MLLVIAPHPDDETLGCGGTIAARAEAGEPVEVVIMTDPMPLLARYAHEDDPVKRRREETDRAAKVLGVQQVHRAGLTEIDLAARPLHRLADYIAGLLVETGADDLLVPHWADLHQDHRIVAEACLIAARPFTALGLRRVRAYPVDVAWPAAAGTRLTSFVSLSEWALGRKLAALACYASELREFPHPRSLDAVRAFAAAQGARVGRDVVEPFELVWEIDT